MHSNAWRKLVRRGGLLVVLLGGALALGVLVLRSQPTPDWTNIDRAVALKRWDEATDLLRHRVEQEPREDRAWLRLGAVENLRGNDDEALSAFGRIASDSPAWLVSQASIGEIHLRRFEAAAAEEALWNAIRGDPNAVEPRRRLVFLLTIQWRNDEARDLLWELYRLTRDPHHLVTLSGLAGVETDNREFNAFLDRFLKRTPHDPWLRRARGLSLLRQGRPAEALAHLEAVAEVFEDDLEGQLALAECRILLGDSAGPDELLGPEPDRPDARARWYVLQGRMEEDRGRPEAAIEAYRAALEADPENRVAQYRLAQALIARGETESAKTHLELAEHRRERQYTLRYALNRQIRGSQDAEEFERLGHLCRDVGLLAEAKAWYGEALRLDLSRSSARAARTALESTTELAPELALVVPRLMADRHRATAVDSLDRQGIDLEERSASVVRFEEVARTARLDFAYDSGRSEDLYLADTTGGGVGLFDYDGDGWLDIYFVNGGPLPLDPNDLPTPNKLFRNNGDGTFNDVTESAGVAGLGYGMGCAVGDFDNDGHDDLFVTGLGRTILYRNNGDGTFTDITEPAGVGSERWTTAAGFADLDGDGHLDLVVIAYVDARPGEEPECLDQTGRPIHCPPGMFTIQHDHLFRNNGDGTFTDITAEASLEPSEGAGPGLGLAIADFDGDGRLDIYVANDAAPDFLYRNLGGLRFEEVGRLSGLAYSGDGIATASMGVVAEDLDGDRLIDLFHTNFLNEPNTLHRNHGGGLFHDVTVVAGLDAPSRPVTGWGAVALDAANDGVLDLFYANGHVDHQPWIERPMAQPPQLLLGRGEGRFTPATDSSGAYFSGSYVGRGVASGDLDNDGRVDLVVVHRDAPAALLRNTSRAGHWLSVRLQGETSASTPVGTRVTCEAGGRSTIRTLTSGTSYLSASDQRLHFGLGAAGTVDRLEVRWPSGLLQEWTDLPADRIYEIQEGADPRPWADVSIR